MESFHVVRKIKDDLLLIKVPLVIILVYCVFMQITFGTVCPFKAIFNIDCPGCGLTHAVIYLFTGNFVKSFSYNKTAILWVISIILFIVDRYFYRLRIVKFLFIITGLLTIINYVFKVFF